MRRSFRTFELLFNLIYFAFFISVLSFFLPRRLLFVLMLTHSRPLLNRFVDRYIPGYIFFSDGIVRGSSTSGSQTDTGDSLRRPPKWIGKSLRITIGEERQYVGEEVF